MTKIQIQIIGGGGHAKVVIQTAKAAGFDPVSVFDDNEDLQGGKICGVPVVGKIRDALRSDLPTVLALGNNVLRERLSNSFALSWITIIHPAAVVDPTVEVGEGAVVFAQAVIQVDARIGRHAIVNTAASIDHDCHIGDFAHIAPGCHLSGAVRVGQGTLLGVGSCVKPGVVIGRWSTVGAGAAVVDDIPDDVTAVGVPALFSS